MNKKIILSLSVIGIVAAIAIGGTVAYFSDTETSTGNILVAGSLDLKVDHTKQTYNGVDCETCSLTLYSGDGGAQVVDGDNTVLVSFPFPAVVVTPTSITTQYWVTHSIADWIWASASTLVGDDGSEGDVTYTFEHKFTWWGDAVNVDLLMNVAADNQYQILLNGNEIASGLGSAEYTTLDPVAQGAFLSEVNPGENVLTFLVTNKVNTPDHNTPLYNPGGLLYYLTVTRDPEDCDENSDFQQACWLWTEKDLDEGDTFFNFNDVKPGDSGTNVISLHVYNNDAWVCMFTDNVVNEEVSLIEPELKMNPIDTGPEGELGKNINIFMWRDTNNDGIYDVGESSLGSYTLEGNSIIPLYDSETLGGLPLIGSNTVSVGLAWCAGNLTATAGLPFGCDGSSMDNYSQSDKVTADLIFRAEQARNQDDFTCIPNNHEEPNNHED